MPLSETSSPVCRRMLQTSVPRLSRSVSSRKRVWNLAKVKSDAAGLLLTLPILTVTFITYNHTDPEVSTYRCDRIVLQYLSARSPYL